MEGIISASNTYVRCLFNSFLMHSFIALHFTQKLGVVPPFFYVGLTVVTPVGVSLDTKMIYIDCIIEIEGRYLPTELVILDMQDFDVNLGMDLLPVYHTSVDCFRKMISFSPVD